MSMPRYKPKIAGAMFDVKPVTDTGRVDVARIENISVQVNLRQRAPRPLKIHDMEEAVGESGSEQTRTQAPPHLPAPEPAPAEPVAQPAVAPVGSSVDTRRRVLEELERSLREDLDVHGTLASAGATLHAVSTANKPRYRPVVNRTGVQAKQHRAILSAISQPLPRDPEEPEAPAPKAKLDALLEDFEYRTPPPRSYLPARQAGNFVFRKKTKTGFFSFKKILFLLAAVALPSLILYGISLKGRVIKEGNEAVENLQSAKDNLERFDFNAASQDFMNAYQQFTRAGDDMNIFGASVGGMLAELPGAGKLKSARNMVQAGQLLADTGRAMADVTAALSKTNWVLNPHSNSRVLAKEILLPIKNAMALAGGNLKKAGALLADVDESLIPEDKRDSFSQFKSKLPEFEKLIAQGADYADFLEGLVGGPGTKKYLLLFQNASELRPTGGFPGTYGVVTVENGSVKEFFADDIYNPDGQLQELLVPPLQLQHITPNWSMRDAGWFIDFPVSARKVMSFFKKEAGYDVDGVITVNPAIVGRILDIVGPIPMPEYGVTLDSGNFLPVMQSEVEYGPGKKTNQPKKIVTDLAPVLFAKLYSADKAKWLQIFNSLVTGMEQKDVLMYFNAGSLEKFVLAKDFGGQVAETDGDFLMAAISNVKGSKTDAVTDTVMKVETYFSDGAVRHKLQITRRHNGGKSKYGFYNRQNPAYIRVLVPKGSELTGISGNSSPGYGPMLNYPKTDFGRDPDLVRLENTITPAGNGAMTYEEAGKTGFGFWLIVDPGEIKTVELEYTVPSPVARSDYRLYVQKQPGLDIKNFEFTLEASGGVGVTKTGPELNFLGGRYVYSGPLNKDLILQASLK